MHVTVTSTFCSEVRVKYVVLATDWR